MVSKENLPSLPHRPGILERWGVRVLFRLNKKYKNKEKEERSFESNATRLILKSVVLSFCIGFFTTVLFVLTSLYLPPLQMHFTLEGLKVISIHLVSILFFTFIEFYLLFRFGLKQAYLMAEYANLELAEEPELFTPVPGMLSRIALEIPDPELRILGINPYKRLNRRTALIKSLFYKLKVMISNLLAKVLLKAILGRTSLRFLIEYISAPITGIWDAVVTWQILSELKARIISRKLAERLLSETEKRKTKFTLEGKECLLRAIANSIVFTKTFHPNFEYLLLKLVKLFQFDYQSTEMDDYDPFLRQLQKCEPSEREFIISTFLIGATFDGKLTKEEWSIVTELLAFSDSPDRLKDTESLNVCIQKGKLKESILLVEKMIS
ncbi:hypothetical protein LPTSP4_23900 [Leptospira ryugenii]|uniref:Uncharacterized protein n=1 Tax=Leptospira ryugenii TaxID=1917863 RepID=A0A2P2E1T8_9LEPT|nr:hypothetical protein [Leptospira ryugenii]GBF50863.1 hypothetical protein LPTSP4_23900 [Leptospira ryugenii]